MALKSKENWWSCERNKTRSREVEKKRNLEVGTVRKSLDKNMSGPNNCYDFIIVICSNIYVDIISYKSERVCNSMNRASSKKKSTWNKNTFLQRKKKTGAVFLKKILDPFLYVSLLVFQEWFIVDACFHLLINDALSFSQEGKFKFNCCIRVFDLWISSVLSIVREGFEDYHYFGHPIFFRCNVTGCYYDQIYVLDGLSSEFFFFFFQCRG